jgi:ribosomal protein S18 acetylase RimI-like enzyme
MIVTLPFASETSLIRAAADHPEITLARMTTEDATIIGTGLAEIDPWARLDFAGERFANFLAAEGDGAFRFKILFGAERAGAVVVRFPWLSGPYLNILGILPAFQRRGVGALALTWLENESRRVAARSIWLCVSSFNVAARAFYERHGYRVAAQLDDLINDGKNEMLMRKKIVQTAASL